MLTVTALSLTFGLLTVVSGATVDMEKYKSLILDIHNDYRRELGAADMQFLVWDDNVAEESHDWAKRCNFEHKGMGENLAYGTDPNYSEEDHIRNGLKMWYDEIKDYSYGQNGCGKSCHYTQLIWAKTSTVGCALEKCSSLSTFGTQAKDATYFVCFYRPEGNWVGDDTYQKGEVCSKCPDETTCSDKLCYGGGDSYNDGKDKDTGDNKEFGQKEKEEEKVPADEGKAGEDGLTKNEKQELENAANSARKAIGLSTTLTWDEKGEIWAKHIVRCEVEYPGPKPYSVVFDKVKTGSDPSKAIAAWAKEGRKSTEVGCRTSGGSYECNRAIILTAGGLRKIACGGKDCGDGQRQLTCLFQ